MTYSNASYFFFSSGQKVMRWMYSVLGGSLRSTNAMSFLRRRHRSNISDCNSASPRAWPLARGREMTALKISDCSIPPVMWRNLSKE